MISSILSAIREWWLSLEPVEPEPERPAYVPGAPLFQVVSRIGRRTRVTWRPCCDEALERVHEDSAYLMHDGDFVTLSLEGDCVALHEVRHG